MGRNCIIWSNFSNLYILDKVLLGSIVSWHNQSVVGINHIYFKIRTLRAVEKPNWLSKLKIKQIEVIVYLRTVNSCIREQEDWSIEKCLENNTNNIQVTYSKNLLYNCQREITSVFTEWFHVTTIQQDTNAVKWQCRKQHCIIATFSIYRKDRYFSLPGNPFNIIASSVRSIQVTRLANRQT